MTLTKRGPIAKKRRKKILKFSKGFRGSNSILFRTANQKVMRAFKYSYADRKKKKGTFRNIWIRRINNESKCLGISYNALIHKFKNLRIKLNRKILSEIIAFDQETFKILTKIN